MSEQPQQEMTVEDLVIQEFNRREDSTKQKGGWGKPDDSPQQQTQQEVDEASVPPAPPVTSKPEPEPTPQGWQYQGVTLSDEQLRYAIETTLWFERLTPEQRKQLADVTDSWQDQARQQQQPQTQVAPPSQEDEIDDPVIAARVAELQGTIRRLEQMVQIQEQRSEQEQLNSAREYVQQVIQTVTDDFVSEHELNDDQRKRLNDLTVESRIALPMTQQYGYEEGLRRAYDYIYNTNEEFRQLELNRQVSAQQRLDAQTKTKQRKAAALTTSGGSVTPKQPGTTPTDMRSAMVEELKEALGQ